MDEPGRLQSLGRKESDTVEQLTLSRLNCCSPPPHADSFLDPRTSTLWFSDLPDLEGVLLLEVDMSCLTTSFKFPECFQ